MLLPNGLLEIGGFQKILSKVESHSRSDQDARISIMARANAQGPDTGIGVLTATALVAAVGNAQTFSCGRDLAAWLGLVPRQTTTGGKPRLLHISKRGNGYLRMLLIHGARTSLPGSCCGGILYASRPFICR